jgi:hypothetical protein
MPPSRARLASDTSVVAQPASSVTASAPSAAQPRRAGAFLLRSRTWHAVRVLSVLLLLGSLLGGCRGEPSPPEAATIPPGTFARVLAELSEARVETLPDTVLYRRRRAEILERAGVTESDLREFAARRGGDADLMSEIYRQVGARLDSAAQH